MSIEAAFAAAAGTAAHELLNVDQSLYTAIHQDFEATDDLTESFVIPIRSGASFSTQVKGRKLCDLQ